MPLPEGTLAVRSRRGAHPRLPPEDDGLLDPDNMPARSRLFLVVPKAADGAAIEVSFPVKSIRNTYAAMPCSVLLSFDRMATNILHCHNLSATAGTSG